MGAPCMSNDGTLLAKGKSTSNTLAKERGTHKLKYRKEQQPSDEEAPIIEDEVVAATSDNDSPEKHESESPDYNLKQYPHLILDKPLEYVKHEDGVTRPVAPRDDIRKLHFIHPLCPNISWVKMGGILQKHIDKYETLKTFWLFEDVYGREKFPKGNHDKHRFVARVFREEMESIWARDWFIQLIGLEDVQRIMSWSFEDKDIPKSN